MQEKLSAEDIDKYSEKYLKMRENSLDRLFVISLTTEKNIENYNKRNDELLQRWKDPIEIFSGIDLSKKLSEVKMNCMRYLAMREESIITLYSREQQYFETSQKRREQDRKMFDLLAEDPNLYAQENEK